MHRHGYSGRKLQMAAGPRRALVRGLATSLVLHEAVTTTEAKAKEVAPFVERLVTHAKKGNLAGRRALQRELLTENAALKLMQEIAPAMAERQGGYTRIIKLANRRGDNAPMVRLALVLDGTKPATAPTVADTARPAKAPAKAAPKTAKKPAAKKTEKATAEVAS